ITLHRTGGHADDRRTEREDETEQDRYAKSVDDAGKHVTRLVVRAEPVPVADRAIGVVDAARIGLAARLPVIEPGRFGGGCLRYLVVHGAVGIADGWPDQPAIGLDLLLDHRIAI